MAFDAITLMPANLYGPGDAFDGEQAHVIPALLRRFHEARLRGNDAVTVWGTATPRREFLHVDDLARAVVHLMREYSGDSPLNVGTGTDISIRDLAGLVREVTGFTGQIEFDPTQPDGMPRKLLDVSHVAALGWRPRIALRDGLRSSYEWFVSQRVTGPALTRAAVKAGTTWAGSGLATEAAGAATCSVVVATRDRPASLARCLQSVRDQRIPGLEIIVADSASRSQEARSIASQFGARYEYVERAGLSRARNRGVRPSLRRKTPRF